MTIETKIQDNFLDKTTFDNMQKFMLSFNFPWFMTSFLTEKEHLQNGLYYSSNSDHLQFTHVFYNNYGATSQYFESIILPILNKIKPISLIKVKANLITKTNQRVIFNYHHDVELHDNVPITTGIFYINTNNGKTMFDDGTEIDSVANRFLSFDADISHTGTTCTDEKCRCLINFNYII